MPYQYVKRRKCTSNAENVRQTQKMSTSRDLHDIFFASVFTFHLCGNFSVRNGFYNVFLRIGPPLLKKSLMENFIFCAVVLTLKVAFLKNVCILSL